MSFLVSGDTAPPKTDGPPEGAEPTNKANKKIDIFALAIRRVFGWLKCSSRKRTTRQDKQPSRIF